MIVPLLLLVAMFLILSVLGWCVLAPVPAAVRHFLLPAAPLFGAALIAGVSSTATRWLAAPQTMIPIGIIAVAAVLVAVGQGHRPWRIGRGALILWIAAPALAVGGALVAGLPTIWVGDERPVAASIILDQFYFASNSSYLTDHAMLPGPVWDSADWAGSASPSLGPVVDVIGNRLRYGQSSVASVLSFLTGHSAASTVTTISVLWLVVVGSAVVTAGRLFGLRARWALVAVPLVTCSYYLTTQSLEGKNDGLLGVSFALIALGLSVAVVRDHRFAWPLILIVAGLAATYSELVLVLVAPVVLIALVAPRREILPRVNRLAGVWAAGAVLAPFAWIWLAQSARIGGRFSEGNTPFEERHGWDLLRSLTGLMVSSDRPVLTALLTVVAVAAVVFVVGGLALAVHRTPVRGAAIGIVVAIGALELSAVRSGAGNLQYRTAQLGYALVLVIALVGWVALLQTRGRTTGAAASRLRPRLLSAAVVGFCLVFAAGNAATAVSFLPRDRAEVQHVPADELADAVSWVRDAGAENVSVVVPRFTDLLWLSLELRADEGVGYPVIPAIYLGDFPHWDQQPDRFYLVGVGATLSGEVTVVHRNARYQLVELGPSGMIVSPYQPTYYWNRLTYMRGFPCARDGSQILVLRGSAGAATLSVASQGRAQVGENLDLEIDGELLTNAAASRNLGAWNVETYVAPRPQISVVTLHPTPDTQSTGATALPVVFGDGSLSANLPELDATLAQSCLTDAQNGAQYMDGYDRNVTLLRSTR